MALCQTNKSADQLFDLLTNKWKKIILCLLNKRKYDEDENMMIYSARI